MQSISHKMKKKDTINNHIQLINDPRLISPQCFSLTPIETVHENPWFVVRNRGGYFTTEYKQPQVIILPIVDNNSIVMVRVKRPVIADIALELPAGSTKEHETPIRAAARELAEETGIEINGLERFEMLSPVSNSIVTVVDFILLSCCGASRRCFRRGRRQSRDRREVGGLPAWRGGRRVDPRLVEGDCERARRLRRTRSVSEDRK